MGCRRHIGYVCQNKGPVKLTHRTFKLKKNDKDNWWISDSMQDLRLKYEEYSGENPLMPKEIKTNEKSYDGKFSFLDFFVKGIS